MNSTTCAASAWVPQFFTAKVMRSSGENLCLSGISEPALAARQRPRLPSGPGIGVGRGRQFILFQQELFKGWMIQLIRVADGERRLPMNASDRFLRFAAECEVMAKFTHSQENRIVWSQMAQRWRRCAELMAERQGAPTAIDDLHAGDRARRRAARRSELSRGDLVLRPHPTRLTPSQH